MPLLQLHGPDLHKGLLAGPVDELVDIIAIHGIEESWTESWTDPVSRVLWLRDLLPKDVRAARVLTYGYNAHGTTLHANWSTDRIQQHAQTLIAELQADRMLEGCSARPIVFICHGLGGILIKKALSYAATRTSKNVQHLYSVFVSTYAILFFGTPHYGTDVKSMLSISRGKSLASKIRHHEDSALASAMAKDGETLQTITEQFTHLMKQFQIFFFWEQMETEGGSYVVEESSAAPTLDNVERAGIYATHADMIRFASSECSGYRIVIEALKRYCKKAPLVIARRWQQAEKELQVALSNEAYELTGIAFDIRNENRPYHYERKTSEQPRNRYFRIPQAVSSIFTGREGITTVLQSAFWGSEEPPCQQKRFIIYGIGGSGKTQFCSKFAQDNRERFWGVFWIDATTMETARHSFAAIGKLGGLEATQSAGKHWLSNSFDPWLLIINNADDPSLDIASLFPEGERGYVLVTTRNPHLRTHGTVGSQQFKGLEEHEAIQLLLRAADSPKPWNEEIEGFSRRIAETLGYLALALIHAGALIMNHMCDLRNYLDFYQEYRRATGVRRSSIDATAEDQSIVNATWEHSLDILRLRRGQAGEDAISILSIVAFFHFEHIRVDILSRALANRKRFHSPEQRKSSSVRLIQSLKLRLLPPPVLPNFLRTLDDESGVHRIRRALHELSSFSLITYDGKHDSFSLHPVVHTWAHDRLNKPDRELWAHMAKNVLAESIQLPPSDSGEIHEEYRRDILLHLNSSLKSHPIEIMDFRSAFGGFRLPLAMSLHYAWVFVFQDQVMTTAKFGYVYLERGQFEAAAQLLSKVKDALIVSRGYKDEKTMTSMLALAHNYWGLGRLQEAIALQLKVIESRRINLGLQHKDTLSSMDQLGKSYWLNGQYKESLDLQTRTVELMTLSLGPEDEATLSAMDNLGLSYGSWKRFQESSDIHDRVWESRKQTLAENHLDTLTAMNNKAMALKDLGCLSEAKSLMIDVVSQRKRKLGKEHPWTLWAICNLAKVYTELGQLEEAESLLVPGVAAGKRSLGDDHLGVLMGVGELARVYARQNRWQEAIKMAEDMTGRVERSRGEGHPDTLFAMSTLALGYHTQGRLNDAIRICEKAKERSTERLPVDFPLVQQIHRQLNTLYKEAGFQAPDNPLQATTSHNDDTRKRIDDENLKRLLSRKTF